jgi:U3 small nucleolar RNA-associated protein 7
MESLLARADAIKPYKKRKNSHTPGSSNQTSKSVAKHLKIPNSLQDTHKLPEDDTYKHIANKKLRTHLNRQSAQGARALALVEDAEMLLMDDAGGMQVESEMDRTWRVGQTEIIQSAGQEAAKGRKEYKLDGGPYRSRYTRNGRYVCLLFVLENRNLIFFLDTLL